MNEEMDKISVRYAAQLFRKSFLASAKAGRMGIPAIPLSELYGKFPSRRVFDYVIVSELPERKCE